MVKHTTIRAFIIKSTAQGLIVEVADGDNDYLCRVINSSLIILMEQATKSSDIPAMRAYVFRLIMSICGLRQEGEMCGTHQHVIIISWGFRQSNRYSKLHFYIQGDKFINFILVVDDMAFDSNSRDLINCFKRQV